MSFLFQAHIHTQVLHHVIRGRTTEFWFAVYKIRTIRVNGKLTFLFSVSLKWNRYCIKCGFFRGIRDIFDCSSLKNASSGRWWWTEGGNERKCIKRFASCWEHKLTFFCKRPFKFMRYFPPSPYRTSIKLHLRILCVFYKPSTWFPVVKTFRLQHTNLCCCRFCWCCCCVVFGNCLKQQQ